MIEQPCDHRDVRRDLAKRSNDGNRCNCCNRGDGGNRGASAFAVRRIAR